MRHLHCERLIMDAIAYLAGALVGLPAILGIARAWHLRVMVGPTPSLSFWMGVVIAIACVAWVSSDVYAQARNPDRTLQAPVEASPGEPAAQPGDEAQADESAPVESAIYNPFSTGFILAQQERPSVVSRSLSAPEPELTMTLAASAAGAVALVWLLRRI